MSYTRPKASDTKAPLVPRIVYRVLCTKVVNAPSKKTGAPMLAIDVQILSPEQVTNGNGAVSHTAGIEGTMYLTFGDKALTSTISALEMMGVPLPDVASSQSEDIENMQAAADGYLPGMTFEMVVSSKAEPMLGPDGVPLKDSAGRVIGGFERADFSSFGIVGLPKKLSELAA